MQWQGFNKPDKEREQNVQWQGFNKPDRTMCAAVERRKTGRLAIYMHARLATMQACAG